MRGACAILSPVACSALEHLSALSHRSSKSNFRTVRCFVICTDATASPNNQRTDAAASIVVVVGGGVVLVVVVLAAVSRSRFRTSVTGLTLQILCV